MIFNCHKCGKSISSKRDLCPYCRCDVAEVGLIVERNGLKESDSLKDRLKGTFAGILSR